MISMQIKHNNNQNLPTYTIAKLSLFADDNKLIKMLLSMMSHSELQNDLNQLIPWPEK